MGARRGGEATNALPLRIPVGIRRVSSLDAELFRRVVAARTPPADAVLPRLSRAADHGLLWLAVACGLGATGGRRRPALERRPQG